MRNDLVKLMVVIAILFSVQRLHRVYSMMGPLALEGQCIDIPRDMFNSVNAKIIKNKYLSLSSVLSVKLQDELVIGVSVKWSDLRDAGAKKAECK